MPRILAIDYGLKRTGLAVTDPLKIIATALETVETKVLLDFLKNYVLNRNRISTFAKLQFIIKFEYRIFHISAYCH